MNKQLKNFSDEELLNEIFSRAGSKKGLPVKAKCFKCHQEFGIKGNNATRSHSKLYSGKYGVGGHAEDKVCSGCLRFLGTDPKGSLYREKIEKDKRKMLSAYLTANRI